MGIDRDRDYALPNTANGKFIRAATNFASSHKEFGGGYQGIYITDSEGNFLWSGEPSPNSPPDALFQTFSEIVNHYGWKKGKDNRHQQPWLPTGHGVTKNGEVWPSCFARKDGHTAATQMVIVDKAVFDADALKSMVAQDRTTLSTEMCESFLAFMSATPDGSTVPTEGELVSSEIVIEKSKEKRGKNFVFTLSGSLKSEHAVGNAFGLATMELKGEIIVDRTGKVLSLGVMGDGQDKHHGSTIYKDYVVLATWVSE